MWCKTFWVFCLWKLFCFHLTLPFKQSIDWMSCILWNFLFTIMMRLHTVSPPQKKNYQIVQLHHIFWPQNLLKEEKLILPPCPFSKPLHLKHVWAPCNIFKLPSNKRYIHVLSNFLFKHTSLHHQKQNGKRNNK